MVGGGQKCEVAVKEIVTGNCMERTVEQCQIKMAEQDNKARQQSKLAKGQQSKTAE